MTVRRLSAASLLAVAALAVAGTAHARPTVDVKRFHLGVPVTRATIALVPVDGAQSFSVEYRTYADAVANELRNQGFTPVPVDGGPAYIATLTITQNIQVGPKRSGASVGIGGGGFSGGRGGGFGGGGIGVAFPIGGGHSNAVEFDAIGLTIKRAGDQNLIWEGNAQTSIDTRSKQASLARAVPAMARILLADFPGPSGVTQHVPLK